MTTGSLTNQTVAVSGRLDSMTHADLASLVARHGGRLVRNVSVDTDYLVIGGSSSDRETTKSRAAAELSEAGAAIQIVSEPDFLARLRSDDSGTIRGRHSLDEVAALIGVPEATIRVWVRDGHVRPADTIGRLSLFDFADVARLRSLAELRSTGLSSSQLRTAVQDLDAWDDALATIDHEASYPRRVVFRLGDGRLTEIGGQLLFDFGEGVQQPTALPLPVAPLLDRAIAYEEADEPELAAAVYQEILDRGDEQPETRFNLANLEFRLARYDEAINRFEEALDRDPEFAEAWNNLGTALLEVNRTDEAIRAFREAVRIRPSYSDAHFNLATVLDDHGRVDHARSHWVAYLDLNDAARRSSRVQRRRMTRSDPAHPEEAAILKFDRYQ